MKFVPLEEAEKSQQPLTFVPLKAEAPKAEAPKAEVKAQTPVAEAPIVTSTTAPKPDANIDPTTGKPYPELRALPEPSVWDKVWAYATRNETLDNKAKAANEYAARKYAAENKVPLSTAYKITKDAHRPVFNPEGRDSTTAAVQSAAAAAKSLPDMPEAALNTTLRAIAGGDVPVKNRTWLDRAINYTTPPKRKGDRNVEAFANVGQSLGYSVTTMVSAAVTNAVAGPYAAGAVGVAVPYRASKNEFLTRLRDNLDEQSEKLYGKPLTEKDWNKAREEFDGAASRYAAWEAVPEALSNLIMLKAFTAPLKAVNSAERLAEITKRGLVSQVSEQGTETITGLGQNKEELRAGLTKEELSVADAFRQQFVQTLITTGVLAGGAKGVQQVNKFYENYVEPRVRPGSALARAIQADLNTYLEQKPAEAAQYTFVPLASISTPAVPEPPRPELKDLEAARRPNLETEAPPDRTLSALEKARNEGIEVEAPPGPTLSAMERARNEGVEGAPVTPPIEARVQARTIEYERQGYMQDDARLMAERDIAAEARQDVGGRAIQRQDSEDERRTAEGRAERAAMSMEAPSELPEPPSYVTEPSTDEYGTAVPSRTDRTARGPVSAFDRGLDTARSITGELDARERTERASLDANQRRIESDISKAFAREATPDLGPILGASWTRSTLARNPTPEEYQDAAYARLEELDGQRPDDAGPAFERTAAQPTTTTEKPSVAQTPEAVEAKEERQAEPAKPAASTVAEEETKLETLIKATEDRYTALEAAKEAQKAAISEYDKTPGSRSDDRSSPEYRKLETATSAVAQAEREYQAAARAEDKQYEKFNAAKQEGRAKPAAALTKPKPTEAKPLTPTEFEPLELEAGRNEALEVEPSEIAEVKKAEQELTKAGTPRQRAPGAGRPKSETAKTAAERVAQSNALNKFNRDVALLIEKAKEFSERQAMETFETPDEFEYKEALRDKYADQMRAIIYGLSQRTGSMTQGVIDAKGYIRSLPAALRERAKALHEGTAKLEDYHEIPPKPEVLIDRERKSAEYKKARAEGKAKKEALGKPLAATRRTFTDAFNKWFGDSKVVDENGNPLQVYHTGVVDAEEIISGAEVQRRLGKELIFANEGVYFSADPIYSSQYGRNREGVVMYPVYLSIQNPLVITDKKELTRLEKLKRVFLSSKAREDVKVADVTDRMVSMYITEKYKAELIAQGYDGIINEAYNEIVVFEPNQIKSVFNENPTTDPRILAATRREEQEELGLSDSDIYRIEQQLDMRPDPTFNELTSLTGALVYISESPNQLEAELAARLLQDDNIDMVEETSFGVVERDSEGVDPEAKAMLDDNAAGVYVPYTDGGSVLVSGASYGEGQGINNEIVLHEAMHAVGAKKIAFVEMAERNDAPVPARLAEAVHQLRDLMTRARETYARLKSEGTAPSNLDRLADAKAFTDIQEFYAYGMTDPDMKLFLKDEVPGTSTKTNGFDRFVEILMRLLGVNPELKSGLKDLLMISHEIMQAKKPSAKKLAELARNDLGGPMAAKRNDVKNTTTQAKEETKADAEEAKLDTPIFEDQLQAIGLTQKAARTAEGFLNYFVENYYNMTGTAREFWLGQVPTDALLRTMKRAEIKQGEVIKELMRGANTFKLGQMKLVESLGKEWLALKSKEGIRLAEVMHQSTIARVDPSKDKSNGKLNRMWDALTPKLVRCTTRCGTTTPRKLDWHMQR